MMAANYRGEEGTKLGEDALRAAKAHLDSSFDYFMNVVQARTDWRPSITKAKWTLGKTSKRIFSFAIQDEDRGERRTRELTTKKRRMTDEESPANSTRSTTSPDFSSKPISKESFKNRQLRARKLLKRARIFKTNRLQRQTTGSQPKP